MLMLMLVFVIELQRKVLERGGAIAKSPQRPL
jgi:hypothetical protein